MAMDLHNRFRHYDTYSHSVSNFVTRLSDALLIDSGRMDRNPRVTLPPERLVSHRRGEGSCNNSTWPAQELYLGQNSIQACSIKLAVLATPYHIHACVYLLFE
jgi:hypothetical protein